SPRIHASFWAACCHPAVAVAGRRAFAPELGACPPQTPAPRRDPRIPTPARRALREPATRCPLRAPRGVMEMARQTPPAAAPSMCMRPSLLEDRRVERSLRPAPPDAFHSRARVHQFQRGTSARRAQPPQHSMARPPAAFATRAARRSVREECSARSRAGRALYVTEPLAEEPLVPTVPRI